MENNSNLNSVPEANTAKFLEIKNNLIPPDEKEALTKILSKQHALMYQAVPLSIVDNKVNIGIVDYKNKELLKKLNQITNYELVTVPIKPEMFVALYNSLYDENEQLNTSSTQTISSKTDKPFNWQLVVLIVLTILLFTFDVFFRHPIYWIFTILIWFYVWYNLKQK